jgi:uncharacterized protein
MSRMTQADPIFIAFAGSTRIAQGAIDDVARVVHGRHIAHEPAPVLIFDAATSASVDLDLRGDADEAAARARARFAPSADEARGRGRPKLGVEAHEVTLLPRHWDWLRTQPGGASVALRKLVEAASRDPKELRRRAQDCAYRFMSAIGGDLPAFEEAARMLFAGDGAGFAGQIAGWPTDIRDHLLRLAAPAFAGEAARS